MQNHKPMRNTTIDILRMFCAIIVISIHAHLFESNTYMGLGVARIKVIAVPFFAIVAGYYLSQNFAQKGIHYSIRYIVRLLLVYLGASAFMYINMMWAQLQTDGYLYMNWYHLLIAHAKEGHLWFLISLAFFTLLFTVWESIRKFLHLKTNYLGVILILAIAVIAQLKDNYYNLPGNQIGHFFDAQHNFFIKTSFSTFPYLGAGIFLQRHPSWIERLSPKLTQKIFGLAVLLYIMESMVGLYLGLPKAFLSGGIPPLYLIIALFVFALRNPTILSTDPRHGDYCRKLSAYTYYTHPFWLFFAPYGTAYLGDCGAGEYFIIALGLSLLIGSVIYLINNKYLNIVFT